MGKFHINKKGKMTKCNATTQVCPLGGIHIEANNIEEAQQYFNKLMTKEHSLLAKNSENKITEEPKRIEDTEDYKKYLRKAKNNKKFNLQDVPKEYITQEICEAAVEKNTYNLARVPEKFKTQEMCEAAVEQNEYCLDSVPENLISQKMVNKILEEGSYMTRYVPLKYFTPQITNEMIENRKFRFIRKEALTQEMCETAVKNHGPNFEYVPEEFKTQEMCETAVKNHGSNFKYVPEEFKTKKLCEAAFEAELSKKYPDPDRLIENVPENLKHHFIKAYPKDIEKYNGNRDLSTIKATPQKRADYIKSYKGKLNDKSLGDPELKDVLTNYEYNIFNNANEIAYDIDNWSRNQKDHWNELRSKHISVNYDVENQIINIDYLGQEKIYGNKPIKDILKKHVKIFKETPASKPEDRIKIRFTHLPRDNYRSEPFHTNKGATIVTATV